MYETSGKVALMTFKRPFFYPEKTSLDEYVSYSMLVQAALSQLVRMSIASVL